MGRLPAGLPAPAVVRPHATKRNGASGKETPGTVVGLSSVAGRDVRLAARVRLLEGFLGRTEVSECAQYALHWLTDATGIEQSICLVRAAGEPVMGAAASRGLPADAAATFAISLDDWSSPLVAAIGRPHTLFPAAHTPGDRRRRPSTPFGDAAFHALTLGFSSSSSEQRAFGLLLIGSSNRIVPELEWFTSVFSQKLDQILRSARSRKAIEAGTRARATAHHQRRQRSILLTDTEGRLLIANSRALALFTASEGRGEGAAARCG